METLACIAIARELDRLLEGMYAAGAEQADAGRTLLIRLRRRHGARSGADSGWLVLSSCGGESLVFFDGRKPELRDRAWPAPLSPHVETMVVRSVGHNGMNRVLSFELSKSPDGPTEAALHVELYFARARAYLTDVPAGHVIESFGARRNRYYPPPPPEGKLDPMAEDAQRLSAALPSDPTADDLKKTVLGVGDLLGREAIALSKSSGLSPGAALKEIISNAMEGESKGFLAAPPPERPASGAEPGPRGERPATAQLRAPVAVPFEPRSLMGDKVRRFETVNEAVRSSFIECVETQAQTERARGASRQVRAKLKRIGRTRRALQQELEEAEREGECRRKGELLLAHMSGIPKGAEMAEVPDPEAEGGSLSVRLNPRLTPADNAAAYFRKARKLEKKLSATPARMQELAREERRLREELDSIMSGRVPSGPSGSAGDRKKERPGRQKWPPGISPRTFVSSDGWTMYVGRNNKENDFITFVFAKPNDLWFHAHGVPGSHVVLRREGRKSMPSRRCIEETASVAAHFSRGRTSQTVAVIYTEKRYVRKPRKGKPGAALYSHEKTVMVSPGLPKTGE